MMCRALYYKKVSIAFYNTNCRRVRPKDYGREFRAEGAGPSLYLGPCETGNRARSTDPSFAKYVRATIFVGGVKGHRAIGQIYVSPVALAHCTREPWYN